MNKFKMDKAGNYGEVRSVNGIKPDEHGNVEVVDGYDVVIDLGVLPEEINGSCFNHVTIPSGTFNKIKEKLDNGVHPKGKFMYTIVEKYTDDYGESHEDIKQSSIGITSFTQPDGSGMISVTGYYSVSGSFFILTTNIMDDDSLYSTCMYGLEAELIY